MAVLKPRDEFDCEGFRCIITRTKVKRPSGIDLDHLGFVYDERGRYWSRIVVDTPKLQVEERQHREHLERIERHYHDPI
ncbi:hypothetical protein [Acidiphilium rubrum]|uniref:hypothetical protein n=1 Tax=Acidiphilium rubrum TaxID=526 RepID=UPI002B714EB8|nr:hypothetical protein [Acidiphilium rubrum]HQT86270.1 hypothetical protein [Acidiphilium rubrum]